jgi:hypothetical protein
MDEVELRAKIRELMASRGKDTTQQPSAMSLPI